MLPYCAFQYIEEGAPRYIPVSNWKELFRIVFSRSFLLRVRAGLTKPSDFGWINSHPQSITNLFQILINRSSSKEYDIIC